MTEVLAKDLMNKDVVTLDQAEKVGKAVGLMSIRRIGSVVVTEAGKPVGIFSERDIERLIRGFAFGTAFERETSNISELKLAEAMSKPLVTTNPNATISETYETMIRRNVRHLPVVDGDRLVGIIAERDILRARRMVVLEQLFLSHQ